MKICSQKWKLLQKEKLQKHKFQNKKMIELCMNKQYQLKHQDKQKQKQGHFVFCQDNFIFNSCQSCSTSNFHLNSLKQIKTSQNNQNQARFSKIVQQSNKQVKLSQNLQIGQKTNQQIQKTIKDFKNYLQFNLDQSSSTTKFTSIQKRGENNQTFQINPIYSNSTHKKRLFTIEQETSQYSFTKNMPMQYQSIKSRPSFQKYFQETQNQRYSTIMKISKIKQSNFISTQNQSQNKDEYCDKSYLFISEFQSDRKCPPENQQILNQAIDIDTVSNKKIVKEKFNSVSNKIGKSYQQQTLFSLKQSFKIKNQRIDSNQNMNKQKHKKIKLYSQSKTKTSRT